MSLPNAREALRSRRCLVTGGGGFIGSHLVDALLASGAEVRVLDNFSTGYRANLAHVAGHAKLSVIEADCAEPAVVDSAVQGVDFIFHLAAMASVPRSVREPLLCHAWCATSTINLLQAAREHGVRRLVLSSTSAVYGNSPYVAKREADTPQPLSPYASSKLAAEHHCRAFTSGLGLETVVLRYFNVYGPRQDPRSEYSAVIPRFVSLTLRGERPVIYGDGHQSRDFVYVADVADANLLAATVPGAAGGTFNIARGERTTLWDLIGNLSRLLQCPIDPVLEPHRLGDVRDSQADITQARQQLGLAPQVAIADGLAISLTHYRQASS